MEVKKTVRELEVVTIPGNSDTVTDGDKSLATNAYMEFMRWDDVEVSDEKKLVTFHAIDHVTVKETEETKEVEDDTCQGGDVPPTPGESHIDGANDASIRQGTAFDLEEGVTAYDADGNEIPFTVSPDSIDTCEVGEQTFTYSAEGVTKTRKITVTAISDPTISGLSDLTVGAGEEFDPLDGVTAVDGNGNPAEIVVGEPEPAN